ncbi:putative bcp1-like protein [Phialemonium atrogriseum]|uniref:Protein BCP1 n=1 Tax=Phialemonium atrogriseum TaxID=1093897 RepID=A0AAJ0FKI1_9PEZI|nr:putative bcp1-like protein [Phialemonium atrogriseum]KAK1771626.1 putative bcp1-like protein [Phialemonium atrogriseum]
MAKKRAREADGLQDAAVDSNVDKMDEDDSSDDDDFDIVNVDFEWFNFDPDIDFHGVKTLLRQLFDVDSQLLDLSGLTDLIVEQRTIGSTVKVDDKASDAYAFLTALNLAEHAEKKPVAELLLYLAEKAKSNDALSPVSDLLASRAHVGLILSERLINMPSEIAPPMYSMLADEVEAAVEDKEPYEFSHYLIVSKTYNEVASNLDQSERKKKKAKDESPLFYFHPEDEVLQKHAVAYGGFQYSKDEESVADSKRAFQEMGVKSSGFMILIEAGKFRVAVKAIGDYMSPSA